MTPIRLRGVDPAGALAVTMRWDVAWHDTRPEVSGSALEVGGDPGSPVPSPEDMADEVTTALVSLTVDGHQMTRMIDERRDMHTGPRVSAYRLAEWLVWNWWRLRWEPGRGAGQNDLSWRQAHETASIGGGWLWPRLEFESDGLNVAVRSGATEHSETEPVSYLGDDAERYVRAQDFEEGVDAFLVTVLSRLREWKAWNKRPTRAQASLPAMWAELGGERADREGAYRRIEALLGHNPDDGPEDRIAGFVADSRSLGEAAIDEVAAEVSFGTPWLTAKEFGALARASGVEIGGDHGEAAMTDAGMLFMDSDSGLGEAMVPWQAGARAARRFRDAYGLRTGPISDRLLGELCGVRPESLKRSSTTTVPMAFTLTTEARRHPGRYMVFRAKVRTGRRFEAARLSLRAAVGGTPRTRNIVATIRARMAPLGDVDLELPPREAGREPPSFE